MTSHRPILAVVSARPAGDGVGYTGLLLARALTEIAGRAPEIIGLEPAKAGTVTRREQFSFLARLTLSQRATPPLPVVFNHIGIARAQLRVPSPLRRPYAVLLHGVEVWDPALDPDRKNAIRQAAVRLSNSRYTAARVSKLHPGLGTIHPCPLALLPDGQPPTSEDVHEATQLLGSDPRPTVVIVGRMSANERYKGHDDLLEAWPQILAEVPSARLLVVGKGDDADRLRMKARSVGVAGAVQFTGFVPDGVLRALLRGCDVFAMPSRGEGFGLAYLEAMRCGLPCVGSDADAAPEVIADGQTGCIVRAGEPRMLADTIVGLLRNPERARAMGAAGRLREEQVFTFTSFRDHVSAALGTAPGG